VTLVIVGGAPDGYYARALSRPCRSTEVLRMSLTVTLIVLAVCLAVLGIAQIRERRRYEPGRISLIPWVPLQFVAMLGVIVALAHLVTLLTGEPLAGRLQR
jgi:uncharacterized membrane protein YidH (DUF202 family)